MNEAERLAELHYIALHGVANARGAGLPVWDDLGKVEQVSLTDAMELMLGLGHLEIGRFEDEEE